MFESYIDTKRKIRIEDNVLIASELVKPGSILFIEPPLVSVPLPNMRHQRCNYCLKKAKLQCCSRCRSAYFCSNQCFRNAWLHFHRILCEPQETDVYKHVDADRWLLERSALTLNSHERLNKQHSYSPPHLPFAIQALQLHTPSQSKNTQHNQIVNDIWNFLKDTDCQTTIDQLDTLWSRVQSSSFPILDTDHHMEQIAIGVYPLTSLFATHSCRPNAALVYRENNQYLISIQDILPGEHITIAYVDLLSTKSERTKKLQERFGSNFTCHCVRCEGSLSCVDEALQKGESLEITSDQAQQSISEHIKSWSILELSKRNEHIDDSDSLLSVQTLEPPQFSHHISQIAFPNLYFDRANSSKKSANLDMAIKDGVINISEHIPRAMEAILNIPKTPAFTLSYIRAAERILVQKITEGSWVQASRCSIYLSVIYRLIYPPLHPKLAYHIIITARSAWNALVEMELIGVEKKLERVYANGTKSWIEQAKEVASIIFDQNSKLWKDVIELEWVYERERKIKSKT